MTDTILIHEAGGVMELRLNRPEKKNAILGGMYDALTAALHDAAARPEVRAVLIAAEGDTFTAGNDIRDFLAMSSGLRDAPPAVFIRAIAAFGKPLVAAVQGPAVGVGTTLLLHCDLVYASPAATFSAPFVDLGLVPEAGSSLLLPARIGHARAAALLMLGESLDAPSALAAGLLTGIMPADELPAHARAKAAKLAAKPAAALAVARALMRGDPAPLQARIREEEEAFGRALASPEARAAFSAFLDRKAPRVA